MESNRHTNSQKDSSFFFGRASQKDVHIVPVYAFRSGIFLEVRFLGTENVRLGFGCFLLEREPLSRVVEALDIEGEAVQWHYGVIAGDWRWSRFGSRKCLLRW